MKFRFHWSSEIYSLGKTYRIWLGLPRFFPLLFTSDHGVGFGSAMDPEILAKKIRARIHLTFSPSIQSIYSNQKELKVWLVPHPWINYLAKRDPNLETEKKGSIFFPYHTSGGSVVSGYSDESSITMLKNLPDHYHPVVVSLHESDLQSPRASIFQRDFEVRTAGKGFSEDYVDGFLQMVKDRKYAFSESWGSQVFYCTFLGIPVQVIPRDIKVIDVASGTEIVGKSDLIYKNLEIYANEIFSELPTEVTKQQREFVEYYLGLHANTQYLKSKVLLQIFLIFPNWFLKNILRDNFMIILIELKSIFYRLKGKTQ